MLKIPEKYKKYDAEIYYLVWHWSSRDSEGFKTLEGCSIFKNMKKAEKKAENEGCFDRTVFEGRIKDLAENIRKEISKNNIKFKGLTVEEKELFEAYYNHFVAKDLNEASIKRQRRRAKSMRNNKKQEVI